MKIARILQLLGLLIVCFLVAIALMVTNGSHRNILISLVATTLPVPELGEAENEGEHAYWFDDYYTVFPIDEDTYGIGETRYHQMNFNYLILGTSRAILFDSGPGVRDITKVVRSLTSLPVTSALSHLHYDHTGNYNRFESSAMIDLAALRERTQGSELPLKDAEHLGFVEAFETPTLRISEWWKPGEEIDLGGRRLIVHHTPGHTPESVILEDPERGQFFSGDTYYPGELFAFLPGSSLGDYLRTTEALLSRLTEASILYGAHRATPLNLPTLEQADLEKLLAVLRGVRDGGDAAAIEEGFFPRSIEINKKMTMLMDFPAGRQWD